MDGINVKYIPYWENKNCPKTIKNVHEAERGRGLP
jgi:tellurite resistance-related uncharacterized protein